MRQIKFRGLNRTSGEWRYGYLVVDEKYTQIWQEGDIPVIVDPETVGQYTDRHDKNNVEIFEGDLLKHDLWGMDEVIWDKEGACFRGTSETHDITLASHQLQRSRVIGNKFENKELLK